MPNHTDASDETHKCLRWNRVHSQVDETGAQTGAKGTRQGQQRQGCLDKHSCVLVAEDQGVRAQRKKQVIKRTKKEWDAAQANRLLPSGGQQRVCVCAVFLGPHTTPRSGNV